jgi:hypothetical protein
MAKFTIETITDLEYIDSEGIRINALIKYAGFPTPHISTLDPADTESHVLEAHTRCIEGEFGAIAPYAPSLSVLQDTVRAARDLVILQYVDPYQMPLRYNDLSPAQQTELAEYRTDLLNIPQQTIFNTDPNSVIWPTKPTWI